VFCRAETFTRETRLDAAGLREDAALLKLAFEELHPGLYRYNSNADIDSAFALFDLQSNNGPSLQEAYLNLSALTAKIKCGHTYPNFFNQSKKVKHALFEGNDKLPFFYRWILGRMVVTSDFTTNRCLPPGSEVLEINGVPTRRVLAAMLPFVRGDGANDVKRVNLLQVQGDDDYETADVYMPMIFTNWHYPFSLVVRRFGEHETRLLQVAAQSFTERRSHLLPEPIVNDTKPFFTLSYFDRRSALLAMPTWEMWNTKWDWENWLNGKLDEIIDRRCPTLIVDLRGNEGGNDVGDVILRRLGCGEDRDLSTAALVRYKKIPDDLYQRLNIQDDAVKDLTAEVADLPKPWPTAPPVRYYRLVAKGESTKPSTEPTRRRFLGQVFVLIDGANSSATFNFAQKIQSQHLGILVGEPTGGNRRGINGGRFIFLRLPHSGLEVDIPLIAEFAAIMPRNEGLKPDIEVDLTPEDIANRKDPVLSKVRSLLSAESKN
jgi:hypothetical protein